jgi:hypothetical protein
MVWIRLLDPLSKDTSFLKTNSLPRLYKKINCLKESHSIGKQANSIFSTPPLFEIQICCVAYRVR